MTAVAPPIRGAQAMTRYVSLHAYCFAPSPLLDQALSETVFPLLATLRQAGQLAGWFFIRYWEGGPHLRLRLRGADAQAVERVRNLLNTALAPLDHNRDSIDPAAYYATFLNRADGAAGQRWEEHGVVRDQPYEPEVQRYGGPAAMELSEQFFETSSAFAAQLLPLTPSRAARLGLGLQLLLTTLRALGLDTPSALKWLRGFVNAWPLFSSTPPAQVAQAREHAERTYFAAPLTFAPYRSAYSDAPARSLLRAWHHEVQQTQHGYLAMEASLTYGPLEIWRSQLHMFHNRLGFDISDECYLATLAALIIADRGGERLHPDWTSDHRAHEDSKLYPHTIGQLRATAPPEPRPLPTWPGQRRIALPPLAEGVLDMALGDALHRRKSHYLQYGAPLALDELSTLLRGSVGVLGTRTIRHLGGSFAVHRRPYPSGGGRYPWRLHLLAYQVEPLVAGHYCFDEYSGELVRFGTVPPLALLERSSPFLSPDAPDTLPTRDVAAWIFPVLDLAYLKTHYHHRAYRHALLECGHLTQNLCLIAAALGLPHLTLGGFYDDAVNSLLHLDGVNEFAVYMLPVGGQPNPLP